MSFSEAFPSVPTNAVQVISKTWVRDSHDLFDFEARQMQTSTFTVRKSTRCIRKGAEVQMQDEHDEPAPESESLLRVMEKSGRYWVDKASLSSNSKKLWLVVRDLKNDISDHGCCLTANDVIKLGRFKFRVRQLVSNPLTDVQPELKLIGGASDCCTAHTVGFESTMCRICLLEGAGEDDPLIAPCNCKGSIEHVHVKCLRHWIKGRLNISDNPSGSYFFRPLACELCKGVYPTYIDTPSAGALSVQTPLVEVPRTQAPFIVLENTVRDSQVHSNRGLHVLSLAGKTLRLGRGHESDVRIADVSISRHHATIRFHQGEFLLQDNNSKFGTLVAVKKPQQVQAARPLSLQIGRTVLSLSMQSPSSDSSSVATEVSQNPTFGDEVTPMEMSL